MNVHHLELFYYVARYGGISSAIRHMPYGIQQPAVSGQILALEAYLGQKLFYRRPFALTPGGERLYHFIQPFFGNLGQVADELRGHQTSRLRLAASSALLREYGPRLLNGLREQVPELKLVLRDANQTMAEAYLLSQEVDLAITELYAKPPAGLRHEPLVEAPLMLLVPATLATGDAQQLLAERPLPLISVPADTAIYKTFHDGLRKLGTEWEIGIELSNLEMVQTYVAAGFGIGLSLVTAGSTFGNGVRALPLKGHARLNIAAFWQEPVPRLAALFLDGVRRTARQVQMEIDAFAPEGKRGAR
ncbi:MAG TPA: LysR family transcriptional regulator [Chthoniobacterales bacterium]